MLKFNNEHCNVEEMIKVRERIRNEATDDTFNMASFCGTARCIAGWAVVGAELVDGIIYPAFDVSDIAKKQLGLTPEQADMLFFAHADPYYKADGRYVIPQLHTVTKEQAIQAIDNVIADGAPHWQELLDY